MSDRGDWDPWDFGDPEDEPWEEPTQAAGGGGDGPYGAPAWEEPGRPVAAGGPPRGALLTALAVMLVLAVGIAAVVLRGDDDGDGGAGEDEASSEVETDDEVTTSSSSSTSTSTSTTAVPAEDGVAEDGPEATSTTRRGTSTSAPSRPGAGPVSTTVPSDDGEVPGCGEGGGGAPTPPPDDWASRWTSRPSPNRHMTLSICAEDVTPRAGQPVTFYVKADDPDAPIAGDACGLRVEWAGRTDDNCYDVVRAGDGPQPPPNPAPGRRYLTVTHVFGSPGSVTVAAVAHSAAASDQPGPYADDAVARVAITVLP